MAFAVHLIATVFQKPCFRNSVTLQNKQHLVQTSTFEPVISIIGITGAIFLCHWGTQQYDTFSCRDVLQPGCQIKELNLFVLCVIQMHSTKKGCNANGNNPIVFFSCALFCFQVLRNSLFFLVYVMDCTPGMMSCIIAFSLKCQLTFTLVLCSIMNI